MKIGIPAKAMLLGGTAFLLMVGFTLGGLYAEEKTRSAMETEFQAEIAGIRADERARTIEGLSFLLWDNPDRSDEELSAFLNEGLEKGDLLSLQPEGNTLWIIFETEEGKNYIPLVCWPRE